MRSIRQRSASLFALLALGLVSLPAQAAGEGARLVDIMQLDLSLLTGAEGAQLKAKDSRITPAFTACQRAEAPALVRLHTGGFLERQLSPAELEAAATFFASPTGLKYTRIGMVRLRQSVGLPAQEAEPPMDAADMKALEAFYRSPAGTKLIREQILVSPEARAGIRAITDRVVQTCMAPPAAPGN